MLGVPTPTHTHQKKFKLFREQAQAAKRPFLYRNHRPDNPPKWDGTQTIAF
jgi:hypothetical protein